MKFKDLIQFLLLVGHLRAVEAGWSDSQGGQAIRQARCTPQHLPGKLTAASCVNLVC